MIFPENWKDEIKYKTNGYVAIMLGNRDELQQVLDYSVTYNRKPLCMSETHNNYTVILG